MTIFLIFRLFSIDLSKVEKVGRIEPESYA